MEKKIVNSKGNKELLRRMAENEGLKHIEEIFAKFLGSFSMHTLDKDSALYKRSLESLALRPSKSTVSTLDKAFISVLEAAISASGKSKKTEVFKCADAYYGLCQPLTDHGEIAGYLIACGLKKEPPESMVSLFGYFVQTILGGIKKEIELDGLYKTIKPRAIALSTVHTVHRLITSSLYLDELLARIARLSMQIIKADRCSIKLVDSKRKVLLPKTTVDVRTKKAKLKKVKIGRWAPGKAVKYGKSICGDTYLATPLIDEDVIGVITLYDKTDKQPFNNFDEEIMKTLCEQAAIAIRNAQLYKEQEKLTMGSINALAQIIESRGPGIYAPNTSYLRIVQLIGQEFGMREHDLKILQYAALLRDAGELMVPEKVLRKKGKLTEREYMLVKEHPLKGAKIIKSLKSLKSVAPIIMFHHENYNGTGYPKGLKGNEIPLGARIMAVVDAFEAMIAKRPYRVAYSIDRATEEIRKNAGRQFDPKVVDAFLRVIKRKDIVNLVKSEVYGSRQTATK